MDPNMRCTKLGTNISGIASSKYIKVYPQKVMQSILIQKKNYTSYDNIKNRDNAQR